MGRRGSVHNFGGHGVGKRISRDEDRWTDRVIEATCSMKKTVKWRRYTVYVWWLPGKFD